MKRFNLICVLIMMATVAYAQPGLSSLSISNGKWVSQQDSLTSIVVKDGALYAYYKGVVKDNVVYEPSASSCASEYKAKNEGAFFLLWQDGSCYEVESSSDYLRLINTGSGKSITYLKH